MRVTATMRMARSATASIAPLAPIASAIFGLAKGRRAGPPFSGVLKAPGGLLPDRGAPSAIRASPGEVMTCALESTGSALVASGSDGGEMEYGEGRRSVQRSSSGFA